jgi:tRNA-dihydrouridine synthase B
VGIPVIANGDIDSPQKARQVLEATGADGLMIGRAAQGRPWIFDRIGHYLHRGELLPDPGPERIRELLLGHLDELYRFYGDEHGVKVARKHIGWYCTAQPNSAVFRQRIFRVETSRRQRQMVSDYFNGLTEHTSGEQQRVA